MGGLCKSPWKVWDLKHGMDFNKKRINKKTKAEGINGHTKKSEKKILDLVLGGGQTTDGLKCHCRKPAIPKGYSTEQFLWDVDKG